MSQTISEKILNNLTFFCKIVLGDCRNMKDSKDDSVNLIVTSPPYFNAKNYSDDKSGKDLGNINDYELWKKEIKNVWKECFRVLQPGRKMFINIMNLPLSNEKNNGNGFKTLNIVGHTIDMCGDIGFIFKREIIWHKTNAVKAHFGCVDQDTEILTKYGWKKYDEVNVEDEVATYNISKNKISFGKIKKIFIYNVKNEEMVHIGKRDLDIFVTKNHRMLVKKRCGSLRTIFAKNIAYSDKIPISGIWQDEGVIPNDYTNNHHSSKEELWELLGWFIAEGSFGKNNCAFIYQNESEKSNNIKKLLDALQIEYSIYRRKRNNSELTFYIPSRHVEKLQLVKEIKDEFIDLPLNLNNALLNGLIGGDGCKSKEGRIKFIQKSNSLINKFQILAERSGFSCTVAKRKDEMWVAYLTRRNWAGIRNMYGKNISYKSYTGIVWCVHVPSTYWVARRSGKPFITGNSFPYPGGILINNMHEQILEFEKPAPKGYNKYAHLTKEQKEASKISKDFWLSLKNSDVWLMKPYKSGSREHLAPFPLELPEKLIKAYSYIGETVLDPFAGMGTTAKAALKNQRNAVLYEINNSFLTLIENNLPSPFFTKYEKEIIYQEKETK